MDFTKQVIEKSKSIPVLVDFWAPWCAPCRFLGPILEELASEQNNLWELVKINTEEYPDIAMKYGIRSIPNVKLFYNGEIINEFMGALPKYAIEDWLGKNIPIRSDKELENILRTAKSLPDKRLIKKLKNHLGKNPGHLKAEVEIAKHLAFSDPEEAESYLPKVEMNHLLYDTVEDVKVVVEFQKRNYPSDSKIGSVMNAGKEAIRKNEYEEALKQIIEATTIQKSYENDLPRRLAIALFHLFGNQNELTRKYRRQFDMALY